MPIDFSTYPPELKLALLADGEAFGSEDTYNQATQTLQGLEKYASVLQPHGLPLDDTATLGEARDMLSAAGFGRNQAKAKRKTLLVGLDDAERLARPVRLRGRAVLSTVARILLKQSQTEPFNVVQTVLDATSDSAKQGEELAKQLDQLGATLDAAKEPIIADAAASCGGPETHAALTTAGAAIRDALKKKPTVLGTPEETQRIDLIDGVIIDICRRARDAAESASKESGDPALLKAFKLDKLYASRLSAKKDDKADDKGEGGGENVSPPVAPSNGSSPATP
jgi:hypothetical protein